MKYFWLFFWIFVFIVALYVALNYPVQRITDFALAHNDTITAGHGEVCKTPYNTFPCEKGLVCKIITNETSKTGVCLKPNESVEYYYSYLKNKKN
jgi:hypothetical protein